jgi:hypothetical protein
MLLSCADLPPLKKVQKPIRSCALVRFTPRARDSLACPGSDNEAILRHVIPPRSADVERADHGSRCGMLSESAKKRQNGGERG